ncbi:MAG: trypsin-like peptidase domain-containing protein [Clostridia bacterium]|nr:trypsin-like peptidase domain-containing protein [Clostridia bacterium]
MKKNRKSSGSMILSVMLALSLALCGGMATGIVPTMVSANAETSVPAPAADTSPAIYVAEKNANSVVGIITNKQDWNRATGETEETMIGQGSGVVIAEGGYVLTNNHVIEGGSAFQVLMPNGDKVSATLIGADASLDLAVVKLNERADELVPATIGSSTSLKVGSTAIAIGNPGGEVLANTVTQGIISALERSSVNTDNTTRNVDYIQHDASINNGNSGGGLFDYMGNLIGINTLKYAGSVYSSVSFEGLGFAIPIETAHPIAMQLIEHGKVIRPQMGVTVADYEGPNDPMTNYAPASVCVYTVNEGSPAEAAGMKQYDFITHVNGERVKSLRELTTALDKFNAGDKVTITVARYNNVGYVNNNNYNNYYDPFGFGFNFGFGYGYGNNGGNDNSASSSNGTLQVGGGYSIIDLEVTLEIIE